MNNIHSFHIPVMGLGFTVDTPIKVAHLGITSVVSVMEDGLLEDLRKYYCAHFDIPYKEINENETDSRSRRITAYLDTLKIIVDKKFENLKARPFEKGNDLSTYFELLPDTSNLKKEFDSMCLLPDGNEKFKLQEDLKSKMVQGSIDVNIMSKVDKDSYAKNGTRLPPEYAVAMSALRGFAQSSLASAVVFSAGYNPRLYTYAESFIDFFPDSNGQIRKKIILKVSDYRSAVTQGKILAKKGLWVSEFRVESGLNCGGHAFATEGLLLGSIMNEFKMHLPELTSELRAICNAALTTKQKPLLPGEARIRISVQGGIGTSHEDIFLREYFGADSTGWGSPFLLVPEATNVDNETLEQLASAEEGDYYLSYASPMGIPFNNFRKSASEKQRIKRIRSGKPGSPCFRNYLASNFEFTQKPICTASRQYQRLKIRQLAGIEKSSHEYQLSLDAITEKDCLCTGLSASAYIVSDIIPRYRLRTTAICPGPNLAYFSKIFSLKEMIGHIYGKQNILNTRPRPNLFLKELGLYVNYLKKEWKDKLKNPSTAVKRSLENFKTNLLSGIGFYEKLNLVFNRSNVVAVKEMQTLLEDYKSEICSLQFPDQ